MNLFSSFSRKACIFSLFLCVCLLAGCASSPSPTKDSHTGTSIFSGFTLQAADHPELHFGTAADNSSSVRDFCITAKDTVLILDFSSQHVLEYDFNGNLLADYDFHLTEKGLTACKVAADAQGQIYLLDGHNNAILTADKNGVQNVSNLSITDAGMITQMYVNPHEDSLWVTISQLDRDPDNCQLDVSGSEVRVAKDPVPGNRISDFLTYCPNVQYDADGSLSSSIEVQLYQNEKALRTFTLTSHVPNSAGIVGLKLYGVVNGDYWGKLYEFISDDNDPTGSRLQESFLRIQSGASAPLISDTPLPESDLRQSYGNETYLLHLTKEQLTLLPLADSSQTWNTASSYEISWS